MWGYLSKLQGIRLDCKSYLDRTSTVVACSQTAERPVPKNVFAKTKSLLGHLISVDDVAEPGPGHSHKLHIAVVIVLAATAQALHENP